MINSFEDIISRQKSQELTLKLYKLFSNITDYNFQNQILRAAISISNNIAEWFERKSNNEFKYFLYIAKGSCWEVRSMLYLANKLWFIQTDQQNSLINSCIEISKLLSWLIKTLK